MTMYETHDAAAELVDFWNDILVPKFMKYRHILVGGLTHHSAAILPSLPLAEGDRVLDVGCGFGDTAIHFAKRVAPTGSVVGIDCCEAFLEMARGDATAAGVTNAEFVMGDAQFEPFDPVYVQTAFLVVTVEAPPPDCAQVARRKRDPPVAPP